MEQEQDLKKLMAITQDAGVAIMAVYGTEKLEIQYKDDTSPLTAADQAAHDIILEGLQQNWPDIPVLSEEGGEIPYSVRRNWQRFWLVDPLDGTKEFIKRNGEFTVNIALIEKGCPVLGVVYAPVQEKMYCGVVGVGAYVASCGGALVPIRVRTTDAKVGITVVVSRSHPSAELQTYLRDLKVAETLALGSSLKFCAVAAGRADLYPRLGPTMEWDTAAGHAVVTAAGGEVQMLDGLPLRYNKENLLNPYFIASTFNQEF